MERPPLFIYTPRYSQFDYGRDHPMRLFRLKLTVDLMEHYGLLDPPVEQMEPPLSPEEELLAYHASPYLEALRRAEEEGLANPDMGLGTADNPLFPGVYTLSRLVVGGTLEGTRRALEGRRVFHIGGGMHHARPDRAEGFCYLNDIVIALKEAVNQGARVLYFDIDAHHCDAVQEAFYRDPRVLVVSFHQYGPNFYPGTGALEEVGEGEGRGYNLNLPLDRYTEDETLWWAYEHLLPPLLEAFKPDLLFTQLGVDAHRDDPLTSLFISTHFYERMAQDLASRWQGPWIAVGGGGYDLVNVARIWTLVWGAMVGREVPDTLPESFLRISIMEGYDGPNLRDLPGWSGTPGEVLREVKERVTFLRKACPLLNKT